MERMFFNKLAPLVHVLRWPCIAFFIVLFGLSIAFAPMYLAVERDEVQPACYHLLPRLTCCTEDK